MLAVTHLLAGFAIAHGTLLVFFVIGSAAFPWCERENGSDGAARAMLKVACTCALGMSICGFGLFVTGLLGWLTPAGVAATLAVAFGASCAAWRTSPFRADFWRARLRALTRCWSWPLAAVYAALLVIGTRALLPDATGYSDGIYYHLAYAQDWANAGRIVVDPYLFFPFYANNFLLLYAAWIVAGAGQFVNFLTWTTGLLIALALYASVADYAASKPATRGWSVAIGLLVTYAVVSAPIFLDYAVLGYVDVPIGAAVFLSILAAGLAVRERDRGWLVAAAVVAAFLVGMKASYVVLVPVFAAIIAWAARSIGVPGRTIAAIVALLCVLSAPWYVRNLILAGDPIAPTLNLMLRGQDGLWKPDEWTGLWKDMATSKTPKAFVTLPARAFLRPTSEDFREYGASGLILFLYVPALIAAWALIARRRLPPTLAMAIFALTIFTLYWFLASSLLRYALLFYPLLAFCIAAFLLELVQRFPRWAPVALLLAVVAAMPNLSNPGTIKEFTRNDVMDDFHDVLHYQGDRKYLEENDDGYREQEVAAAWIRANGGGGKVYVISNNAFDYYFRREGITSVGTWIGPAGYFRLLQAIDAGEAADFLDGLDVRAVLYSPQEMIDAGLETVLARQLRAGGFREIPLDPKSGYHLLVRG